MVAGCSAQWNGPGCLGTMWKWTWGTVWTTAMPVFGGSRRRSLPSLRSWLDPAGEHEAPHPMIVCRPNISMTAEILPRVWAKRSRPAPDKAWSRRTSDRTRSRPPAGQPGVTRVLPAAMGERPVALVELPGPARKDTY